MIRRFLEWLGLKPPLYVIKVTPGEPDLQIVTKRTEMHYMPPPGFLAMDEERPNVRAMDDE